MHFKLSRCVLAVFTLASTISASIHKPSKNRGCAAEQNNAVEWDTAGLSGLVSLHLCPGGASDISQSISVIAISVANSGSYNWRPSRSIKSHKSFTIIIIDSTSHSVSSEDFGISGLEKGSMAAGQGYNTTITSEMNNVHETASTQMAVTHETVAPMMPDHSVVVEHSMATVQTAAPMMPEHSVMVEHPMPTIVETEAPMMPEHSVVVEHSMATVQTAAPMMPEHSVMVEHPMPTIVETEAPMMPEHSVVVEHPMLTVVETAPMGHIVGLASTFTRIIIAESHGNTMPLGVETAVQPTLTTFVPESSIFTSEPVATEPASVIATESTRFQGNQTAIAIGTIGTNTRVNSPVFTGGAADNVGSGKVYGVIGAAAVGFVVGIL
ncbi:hypothetical protein VE00_07083 [Pseudogymnoascus sp. WSF 3629]|nr:hypothetical protein VE00_07083 [Pseudogymnoascus sp. WSF 3629]